MPDDSRNDPEVEDAEGRIELPPLPKLPETPVLKPQLPPKERVSARQAEKEDAARNMGLAYVLPTALAAPVVILTIAGWWVDDHFHKSPYFTLGGALLGTVTGFINMIRIAGKMDR